MKKDNIKEYQKMSEIIFDNWDNGLFKIFGVQPIALLCDFFSKNSDDVSDEDLEPYMKWSVQEEIEFLHYFCDYCERKIN